MKGFVTKMEECMGACDCIITKVCFTLASHVENMNFVFVYAYVIELSRLVVMS